jgi:hypothetical protein
MIKVENYVRCYEIEGRDMTIIENPSPVLILRSHWNLQDRVEIETPEGRKYTVLIKDVVAALTNAGNTARF